MLKNDLLLKAAKGENTERIPIWLMRQAGRILPEYRAVRSSVNGFKELVKNPELICEVTIQPVDILDVDAAIIFSDILVIPEAMGLNYEMIESKGPFFPKNRGFCGKCWENDCAAPRPFLPLHRQFEAREAHDGKLTK